MASQQSTADGEPQRVQRIQAPDGHRAALHVGVHVEHALVRSSGWCRRCRSRCPCRRAHSVAARAAAARPVGQAHDAGVARGVAARRRRGRRRRRGAAAAARRRTCSRRPQAARELLEQAAVARRVERVRRQRGEPARELLPAALASVRSSPGGRFARRKIDAREAPRAAAVCS